ncbi:DUF6817 domain-containing protein [Amycolatopsis sp. NPDC059021]|uniref:DUF6817 domain-containing protein n=1 Tax=Amycolatopsis sp. NPDC059021 TaxID=3346704 RepID=UPI00366F8688
MDTQQVATAVALLDRYDAAEIEHPGGTLLAHLVRVEERLARWEARPALRLAGLCHAAYGTDGFPTALMPLGRRAELAAVIGAEAEELVYLYGACGRAASYPRLAEGAPMVDRFSADEFMPSWQQRRDFAELTAANELDLVFASAEFARHAGAGILALLTRFRPLLSEHAWRDHVAAESIVDGE